MNINSAFLANPEFANVFQNNPEDFLQRIQQVHPNLAMQLQFAVAALNQRNQMLNNNNNILTPNANISPIAPMTASTSFETIMAKESPLVNNNILLETEEKPKRRTRCGGGTY